MVALMIELLYKVEKRRAKMKEQDFGYIFNEGAGYCVEGWWG